MSKSIDQQVAMLMERTHYGDAVMRRTMEHELRERLAEGRPLRVYYGIDATTPELHIGHSVPIRKLAQFQALGHECMLLVGDFTARIGDPTERDRTRPLLSAEQVQANGRILAEQASRLLDPERTQVCFNSEWLSRLAFGDIVRLASCFTVAQFLERENFARRYAAGVPIHLHEFFYAVMQGYDAVALQADVQVGGIDQTFNLLAGRRLQESFGQRPQVIVTTPLLPGTDGRQKMSKSLGNAIAAVASAEDMYGRLMSIPDDAMRIYFELLTSCGANDTAALFGELAAGERHPRDVKMLLARLVTSVFHGETAAAQAQAHFARIFQRRELPAELPDHIVREPVLLVDLLVELRIAGSKSEARRLILQGGVRIDGQRITDINNLVAPERCPLVLQAGRRRFIKLRAP